LPELAEVRFFFMRFCLSAGNQSGIICAVHPNQDDDLASGQTQTHEALFTVVLSRILQSQHRGIESLVALGQVDLMLAQVGLSLLGVVDHLQLVYMHLRGWCNLAPNKSLQRAVTDKVLGRGRPSAERTRALRARVLLSRRAAAELSR
jgi:hypothetical protein